MAIPQQAIWHMANTQAEDLHFCHANGFPLEVYEPFLKGLATHYNVSAIKLRALWPNIGKPPRNRSWQLYANDMISFIEHQMQRNQQGPVIAVGHSIGATSTVLAAAKRPDLFKALVLIEPGMAPPSIAALVKVVPKKLVEQFEPSKSALRKKDQWPSRKAYEADFRKVKAFKKWREDCIKAMIAHGVEEEGGQLSLRFSKQWEAHNYSQPANVIGKLSRLSVPVIGIRGKPSVYFDDGIWQQWQRRCPQHIFKENPNYSHLFPMEDPEALLQLVNEGLAELNG